MQYDRKFNFAAGPSILPEEVLLQAQSEMMNYHGSGMSVMEMSHRSSLFQEIFDHTKNQFRKLMNVPDEYEILFLQGGGSTQFSMVPLNLIGVTGSADYAVTGNFSNIAAKEAKKYGEVFVSYDGSENHYKHLPTQEELKFSKNASYFHYCSNNTIFGTEWKYVPEVDVPIVCDMSSDILSQKVDISKYGLIYAGAQKNLAPAGVTVVIIRKDLAGNHRADTPLMLNYETMIQKDSMYNTPPCWNIYMLGLNLDWIEQQGGVDAMEKRKKERSSLLYNVLDDSKLFIAHSDKESRSDMNVTFRTGNEDLDKKFIAEASEHNLINIKGHRLTGGMRASIYNAMPLEGVERLCDFMINFEKRNG